MPVNYRLTSLEVAYIAKSSGAVLMVTQAAFEAHLAAAQAASPALLQVLRTDQPAYAAITSARVAPFAAADVTYHHPLWFFFTSGTTGRAKAAVLTHGQMAFVVTNHLADLLPGLRQSDCSLVVTPLSHGAGIHALVNVARGAASVLLPGESLDCEAAFEAIEKHRMSNIFTVPTILKRLAEDPAASRFDHSSLTHVIYAGAPMYKADQQRALASLGPVMVQYFGLGEVTGNITVLRTDEHVESGGALLGRLELAPDARMSAATPVAGRVSIKVRSLEGVTAGRQTLEDRTFGCRHRLGGRRGADNRLLGLRRGFLGLLRADRAGGGRIGRLVARTGLGDHAGEVR